MNSFIEMSLTEAERGKRYREKHREKVCERDNYRKKAAKITKGIKSRSQQGKTEKSENR